MHEHNIVPGVDLMSFGQWVRRIREAKGLSLTWLADQIETNVSTISRIESESISPTIETAVQILNVLQVTTFDFYQAITDTPFPEIPEQVLNEETESSVPTLDDAVDFDKFFCRDQETGRIFLAKWLNRIHLGLPPGESAKEKTEAFWGEYLDLLLSHSPFCNASLSYPHDMAATTILKIYQQGGVIIREDAFTYMLRSLLEKDLFANTPEIATATIMGQMTDTYAMRKIKLADLVKLDHLCESRGEIPIMCAQAVQFELSFNPQPLKPVPILGRPVYWGLSDFKVGYIFILMSRWIEHLQLSIIDWLQEARELR